MKQWITWIGLLVFSIGFSQTDRQEREAFQLKIALDSVNFYEQEVAKSPYFVYPKVLQIYPGEQLNIEVEIKKDTVFSMKVVDEIRNPKKTITVEFQQLTDGRKHEQSTLKVTNPFNNTLKYNAMMFVIGGKDWMETSILPIPPGLSSYETWADIVGTLVLKDWELQKE